MNIRRLSATAAVLVVSVYPTHARDVTFEERVKAQEAIERVYYAHQIGATKPSSRRRSRRTSSSRSRSRSFGTRR
jgi:hypothetical protein